jgi:hypothetical protein
MPTLAEIRASLKDKVCSLRSTKHWFALRSLTHYALNNLRCAHTSKVIHLPASWPCARMPDAHARRVGAVIGFGESFQVIQRASCRQRHPRPPPAGTAPPSRVVGRHPRRRLGYPRAHVGRPIFIGRFWSNPTVQVFQRFQGARVRHEKMVKRMSATLIRTRKLAPANAGRWF